MLHLRQPCNRHATRRVAVCKGTPAASEPLRVLGVATQNPDMERRTVLELVRRLVLALKRS